MTQIDEKKQRRPLRGLLVASLAVNLLVLGVIGGAVLSHRGGHGGDGPGAKERFGTPYVQALSREDRRAVGRAIRQSYRDGGHTLMGDRALYLQTVEVLRSDAFDPVVLNDTLRDIDRSAEGRRDLARAKLVERISAMTPEERSAYADRLEEVLKRGPDKHKKGKKDLGPKEGPSESD
ncbi:putative membrane protein [Shimia isoporae]|uniref:Putative membrane protein n=1 Tax=Shimia isoporae TaxID=647720 RepID=A0A4R1NNZ1_9RHOB|nr:periplasmic heavy metal sensor [Shimia isoporae]TCL10167.1 putative membrane protein [Shimia isoporae]